MNILLVDDHHESARALARLLRREGHAVLTAGSVFQAMAVASGMPLFDLLISDLSLPDGDGLVLPKALREQCGGGPAHAFALTGHDESYCLLEARRAGYGSYFLKPLVLDQLLVAIGHLSRPAAAPIATACPEARRDHGRTVHAAG